ncbi:MAG: Uma2 family endonuclease [Proteobacteria bacterium]|nr:Uma2 family endonuclease [Pseudomonadota bacterium]
MSAFTAFSPPRHRITVDEYYRMAEAGIFKEEDRVELIEGEIIDMSPIGIDHAYVVKRLNSIFMQSVGMKAIVSVQDPIHLNPRSEPQPDIALLRYREDFYRLAHPIPEDIILLVEVSDTTLRYDKEIKLPLYARHGIPEVWIVDLEHGRLEVYRNPMEDNYLERHCPAKGESIAPKGLPDCRVDLSSLIG